LGKSKSRTLNLGALSERVLTMAHGFIHSGHLPGNIRIVNLG